ncbi:MAG: hypothetical protein IJT72_10710 [Lachnospiraceae bacterium]|nr:hypothetical protein [Lachnospiraceae bacterium]
MADKMSEVYEVYDMEIYQTMRGRGSFILKTDKGIRQLKQLDTNESRLNAEYLFKERLFESGFTRIDRCIKNTDDELISYDRYGNAYVMRTFFEGREIDVFNKEEIKKSVDNLADFHIKSRNAFISTESDVHIRINSDFKKRNRELKRVKNFMLKRKSKKEFEELFLDNYEFFYKQAVDCENKLDESVLKMMAEHTGYCHGMYNQHSIMVDEEDKKLDTVGFDRFYVGSQLNDLYHFMRKTVEKNDYDFEIMREIVEKYGEKCKLSKNDLKYIYILYLYPEKFYKLGNQYINSPKNWISPKMMEKIGKIIAEETKKQALIDKFNSFYLEN